MDFQNIIKSIGFGLKVIGLGPPKHPQIDWIWTETRGPNPIDLRAEAHDFRFKSYYVTCAPDSGFGPIDLGPQNILESIGFEPKLIVQTPSIRGEKPMTFDPNPKTLFALQAWDLHKYLDKTSSFSIKCSLAKTL